MADFLVQHKQELLDVSVHCYLHFSYGKTEKDKISDFPKATKGISQRDKKVPQSPCWRAGTIS